MGVYAIRMKGNPDRVLARVEAPNRRAAVTYGRSEIEAVELSSKEIVEAVQAGKAIVDVADVGGEDQGGEQE